MLRTTLIAALLLTPVAALASGDRHGYGDGYGDRYSAPSRVVVTQPRVAISIGGAPFNGFNAYYQSDGHDERRNHRNHDRRHDNRRGWDD